MKSRASLLMGRTSGDVVALLLAGVLGLACDHPRLRSAADVGKASSDGSDGASKAYQGVIIATLAQSAAGSSCSVFADFATGPGLDLNPSTSSCSCIHFISALPLPSPNAGTVTLSSDRGSAPFATLVPATDGYHGSWDLGYLVAGNYASVASRAWNAGDALTIAATGDVVHAFSDVMRVPALFSGVTPDLTAGSVVIDRAQDFKVTWTPEGKANESVLLVLQQLTPAVQTATTCYCIAPDAAAALTVDASTVSQYSDAAGGTVRLERLITSVASSDNATVTLVGEVAEQSNVIFQ